MKMSSTGAGSSSEMSSSEMSSSSSSSSSSSEVASSSSSTTGSSSFSSMGSSSSTTGAGTTGWGSMTLTGVGPSWTSDSSSTGSLLSSMTVSSMGSMGSMSSTSTSEISASEWSMVSSSFSGTQNNEETIIPGIMGYYEIDRSIASEDRDTNWDVVQVTWNAGSNTFTWTNLAGVSWSLSPISGSGGWDTTQLTVGNENPYFNDGYTSAKIEWGTEEGSQVVTTIKGPWGWPYLRNMQGESAFSSSSMSSSSSFSSSSSTSTSFSSSSSVSSTSSVSITTAIARKPEPNCDDKVRKIRDQRDQELEDARFIKEQQLTQIRLDRETQLETLRRESTERIALIQTTRRQQIQQLLTKREQCDMKNDEETCRAGWDVKIEEKRAHYEEQEEILREER